MGRLPNTNNQVPETIDDAPPPLGEVVEDLYEIPPEYQQKKQVNATSTSERKIRPPAQNQPQSFPPPAESSDYEIPQEWPPRQDQEIPQKWPPSEDQELPQQFPPSQHIDDYPPYERPNSNSTPVQFPPQKEQAFNQPTEQFPPQQHFLQPTASPGVPIGRPMMPTASPSSLIMNNPGVFRQQLYDQGWKSDLFACMDDPENALITACFPCVTFGQIAEILDNGNTSCATSGTFYTCIAFCIAMPCLMSCTYRSKMRAQFRLIESPAPDWIVHCFCEWCALCQEYRELKLRNLDPSIGWLGNLAVQQQMQHNAMAVPMQQRMM